MAFYILRTYLAITIIVAISAMPNGKHPSSVGLAVWDVWKRLKSNCTSCSV